MIEEFEYTGLWWLPEAPEKQICGTLRFTPSEGAVVDLIGSFKGAKTTVVIEPEEIILGCLSNKGNVTLYKCRNAGTSYSSPGFQISSFHAGVVFIGAHFHKPEDIKLRSIYVHYSYLDEWTNISGFDIQGSFDEEVVIKYKVPEPIKASINDDFKICIFTRAEGPSYHVVQKRANIEQKTCIGIKTSEEKSFREYEEIIYQIQNFLSLGVWTPVHPLTIEGMTEANEKVEIFYELLDIPKTSKTLLPDNMLFTFKDIFDKFDVFLRNWFEQAKPSELKPTHDLYFGTLYLPLMYREHHFLSLVQAIESFHRRKYEGKYLSDEDYKKIHGILVDAIPDMVKGGFKESLDNKMKYGNEFSLRKRLKEIFNEYQHEIPNVFMENKGAFIDKVADTRNYLTHYDKDLKERDASGTDLFHLTHELKMLLEICLLRELGFSSEEIKDRSSKILRRYRQYESIQ